jgi:hypothetical protein
MPDNAIYYQLAYGALIVLFAAYALSIRLRRRALARRREAQERMR